MKKTKIIATLGPAVEKYKKLKELKKSGADIFRLNFSHGFKEEQIKRIENIRRLEKEINEPIAILQDLQGQKIRVGNIPGNTLELKAGRGVNLTVSNPEQGEIPVQYKKIISEVEKGDRILLDDGALELKVLSKNKNKINCRIIVGGILLSKKGINLPDSEVSLSGLTHKDKEDLKVGISYDVSYIALSFTKSSKDIEDVRKIIRKAGKDIKIIAKIERHEAIKNIDSIIKAADGVMVARGDLGMEVSLEQVPLIQKEIIKRSMIYGKPVIVATQMLDSMIRNPRSTRAETSDIANAILDGADAVMLSGETSVGKYPVNSVKAMKKIAIATEKWAKDRLFIGKSTVKNIETFADAIGKSTCRLIYDIGAKLIINATSTGETTRALAKFRPYTPIISITSHIKTARELQLIWGVYPFILKYRSIDDMAKKAVNLVKINKFAIDGERAIIIGGQRIGIAGGTNIIKIIEIGKKHY